MTTRGSGVILGSSYHSAQDLWQCADGVKHFKAARFAEQTTTQK
jgi:histidinol phosphatase-like PHP family hydrolase